MRIMIFGGTSEGRELAEKHLRLGDELICCVTSQYAGALLPSGINCLIGAMNAEQMATAMREHKAELILDATHPFAVLATENIRAAAAQTDTPYRRISRPFVKEDWQEQVEWADDLDEAIETLKKTEGKIFLSTGSHSLPLLTRALPPERLVARVLPNSEVLRQCEKLGILPAQMIAMQGPFSEAMNDALYEDYDIRVLLSKDSGAAGGVREKVLPALRRGIRIVMLRRPQILAATPGKKKAILVVSFGSSYPESLEAGIGAIERRAAAAWPDYDLRRAFTSGIIIRKIRERDQIEIDDVHAAMERLLRDGVRELIVQPTHVMNGFEYEEMRETVLRYRGQFDRLEIGRPLLSSTDDYQELVAELAEEMPALREGEALLFMGHGTGHVANAGYMALDYVFKDLGYEQVHVGTVEAYPSLDELLRRLEKSEIKKVYLMPLMIVAGDHASQDMAGDGEESWKNRLMARGYEVECILKGLGEFPGVQKHFLRHIASLSSP